ncbi:MAG: MAPEG family protein [Polymorphobacter sp.]
MQSGILAPVAVLILWSMVMWAWMLATRMPAIKKLGIDLAKVRGTKPNMLDGVLPDKTMWVAHNYNHLMEQPTIFYAVCLTLAMMGMGDGLNAMLAWGYTLIRIAHSLVQATTNIVGIRFALFALSSLCLLALAVHAVLGALLQ